MGSMSEVMQKLREDESVQAPVQEPLAEQAEITPIDETPISQDGGPTAAQDELTDETPVAEALDSLAEELIGAQTELTDETNLEAEVQEATASAEAEPDLAAPEPADLSAIDEIKQIDESATDDEVELTDVAPATETEITDTAPAAETEITDTAPAAETEITDTAPPAETEITDAAPPTEPEIADAAPPAETEIADVTPAVEAPQAQEEEEEWVDLGTEPAPEPPIAAQPTAKTTDLDDVSPATEPTAVPAPQPAQSPAGRSRFEPVQPSEERREVPGGAANGNWDPKQIDPAVVAFHERYSSVTEQFRSVRARLLSMNGSATHRIIAITSSVPQEGKSVSAVNLGFVMAEGGEHRILVADADFRRSSIGRMLGLAARPGLAELIRGEYPADELLCSTPMPNLYVLPPGKMAPQSASELLGSPNTRDVMAHLRASFDYVLLDLPPVNTVSDVSMLAPQCDGVILVVEMHRTPEPTAQQAVRTLQANNARILGCILTRHEDRRTHYYDRYYGYYYRDA
ncbi:MAG: polysaccharide biosynthesis tyrosine autokinase [Phycisphaerae bacterium]|jgi:capsular exopolysaccharide synthesis family protein